MERVGLFVGSQHSFDSYPRIPIGGPIRTVVDGAQEGRCRVRPVAASPHIHPGTGYNVNQDEVDANVSVIEDLL